jgi:hypothetical protein
MNKKIAKTLIDRAKAPLPGRSFVRERGCWNCASFSREKALALWNGQRPGKLAEATALALNSPKGEKDAGVVKIRHYVGMLDHSVSSGAFAVCAAGHSKADLVIHSYMCDHWTAAVGTSARDTQAAGDLPVDELRDVLDGPKAAPKIIVEPVAELASGDAADDVVEAPVEAPAIFTGAESN